METKKVFPIVNSLPTNMNLSLGNIEGQNIALTTDRMSTNLIMIMNALAENVEIFRLLTILDNPLGKNLKLAKVRSGDTIYAQKVFDDKLIIKQDSTSRYTKIFPMPFNPEAQIDEECFIRVYYAEAFGSEMEHGTIYIDIICSDLWWMTDDAVNKNALIRPYALMSRIAEVLSDKSNVRIGRPTGYKHFNVNAKFDCLRMYYVTSSPEKN